MKQFLLLSFMSLFLSVAKANSTVPSDSTINKATELLDCLVLLQERHNLSNRYKIYPTDNIYISLKLDSQTGRIDLIQWSLDSNKEFTAVLNDMDLSCYSGLNSFELYPTQNMYQFILLDKATGRTWHVQWGTESSKMWIKRIY